MFYGRNQDSTRTHRTGYKNVFANYKVTKAWIEKTYPKARSANGNFAYDGDTLYSYREPIAIFTNTRDLFDRPVALITSEKFSVTTQGHKGDAWSVLHRAKYAMFYVPEVSLDEVRLKRNLDYLLSNYQNLIVTLTKCKLNRLEWMTKDHGRPWQMRSEFEDITSIEAAEQSEGYISRLRRDGTYKTIEVYPYLQHETDIVQYLVMRELKRHYEGIVNFAWALRLEIPTRNFEDDAAAIMAVRREREAKYWRPNEVRNRNTRYAKNLFLKLM